MTPSSTMIAETAGASASTAQRTSTEPQEIDYVTHVRHHSPLGNTYPDHAFAHLGQDWRRPPVPPIVPLMQPQQRNQPWRHSNAGQDSGRRLPLPCTHHHR